MIGFEKEICEFFKIPSIPLKKWDGKSSFDNGVAVVKLAYQGEAYAACKFNAEKDEEPRITKVFAQEAFTDIVDIFIVPDYMETNIEDADLDEESKKAAEAMLQEAEELTEKVEEKTDIEKAQEKNEYFFDNIHSDEEAIAFITAYNRDNKIRGNAPKNHDTIIMRLGVIYSNMQKKGSK